MQSQGKGYEDIEVSGSLGRSGFGGGLGFGCFSVQCSSGPRASSTAKASFHCW